MQQILYSQFSDDEVEIIYLNRDKFYEAYGGEHERAPVFSMEEHGRNLCDVDDTFDTFSRINKSSPSTKKNRTLGRGSFFSSSRG